MQLRSRQSGFVRTEGGLLPADLLERVRALDPKVLGTHAEASYGLAEGERFGEATTRAWNAMVGAWATFQDELAKLPATDPATTTTRERFLLPLMETLGYGRLSPTKAVEIDGKAYPISHAWQDSVPLHLVGANVPLDRRTQRVAGAAGQSPHGLLQEFLNRTSDRLWGIVSNGLVLRILRDNASLTRQAYVEFDLQAIMDGESYADFALLWHLAHRSRLEPRLAEGAEEGSAPTVHGCYLERWTKVAEDTGARARERLRDGVQEAIEALGSGFIKHPANTDLRTALQSGELSTQDYYRELLRLVYRLILLFVAEDRDLLLDPKADPDTRERYARYYSMARLRRLAERRKGSRHADLYAGLQVVIAALGRDEGAPGIGLPPLGGFLFGPDGCPHLDGAAVANADLLDAIRKLATIEEAGVLRSVDYRNLASEELGSIYESLLERHPEIDLPSGSFVLKVAAGHERKTTGSYYTPSSLISVLLDSALDPVLDETIAKAATKEAKEQAILEFSVVDPAAGSGHFLVAAAHRIAKRLAQVRTDDEEPAPEAIRTALRDVIGHCLYAVDINPMAVELCKVSLWLEALEPGKPLTFLDAHIKCGNSLLGTTPELIAAGIPDAAYDPIEGDDKEVAKALKKRNRQERDGQLSLGEVQLNLRVLALADAARTMEAMTDEDSISSLRLKEARYRAIEESADLARARNIADAWTAAFVAPKTPGAPVVTSATVRALDGTESTSHVIKELIHRIAGEYRFFHWPVEYPQVMARGGFNVVLGNPPWERVKLQEREFFSERSPTIAKARNAAHRKRMIASLQREDPTLWAAFRDALRRADGESHLLRNAGRYPLTGRGDINTYSVFAEAMRSVLGPAGRVGVIVPTGIATDDTTKVFFGELVSRRAIVSLHGFENEAFIFPDVHHATKFCLLTMSGSQSRVVAADFVFFARRVEDLADSFRHFQLTADDFALVNPNTRTCPIFRSRVDAEITLRVYRQNPVFIDEARGTNPWSISMGEMVHMANDSSRFLDRPGDGRVPLYEAKMFAVLDHRYGTYEGQSQAQANQGTLPRIPEVLKANKSTGVRPQYWMYNADLDARLPDWNRDWLIVWRKITNSVAWRTFIPAVLPRVAVANSAITAVVRSGDVSCLVANLAAMPLDFVARQKLGGSNMAGYITKQLPVLSPEKYGLPAPWADMTLGDWVRRYVVELVATTDDMVPFARDSGWDGPPFKWDAERRKRLFAELDAAYFHLYRLAREEAEHVLESFWIVREKEVKEHGRYRTKEMVLEAYDAMTAATPHRPFVSRLIPPPGDSAVGHANRDRTSHRGWIPWSQMAARAALSEVSPTTPPNSMTPKSPAIASAHQPPAETQLTLATPGPGQERWVGESGVDLGDVRSGAIARHLAFGPGEVMNVRRLDGTYIFRIRFASSVREILSGYGLLEFRLPD